LSKKISVAGLKFLIKLGAYLLACAEGPAGFSKHIGQPPPTLRGAAAKEWRRVAARLYALDRLRPIEIFGLIGYCNTYAWWRKMLSKSESLKQKRRPLAEREIIDGLVVDAHNSLKQWARCFGFFLGEAGMNLDQPLPLEPKRAKSRRGRFLHRRGPRPGESVYQRV
jgi:hypothetical protein